MPTRLPACRSSTSVSRTRGRGFTLIELVAVILILGILAATALPKYAEWRTTARVNAANAAAGALREAAQMAHYSWVITSSDMGSVTVALPNGALAYMWRGYPDAGNCCAPDGIEALIDVSGFDVNRIDNMRTRLEVQGAPTPAECSAMYVEAANPGDTFLVTVTTTGC